MRKFFKELTAITFASLFFVAQSNAFTDLLPAGAASDTIVVSNGSGWTLQQIPDSWAVFRGSLGGNGYSTTGGRAFAAGASFTMFISSNIIRGFTTVALSTWTDSSGGIGSDVLPLSWYSYPGKTIELKGRGLYSTTAVATTWTWGIYIGTTPVCTVTSTPPANQVNQSWIENGILTLVSTGTANTASFLYSLNVSYASSTLNSLLTVSTGSVSAVTGIPFGGDFHSTFMWSVAGSSIQANDFVVEAKN